jgi:hypothetical protein
MRIFKSHVSPLGRRQFFLILIGSTSAQPIKVLIRPLDQRKGKAIFDRQPSGHLTDRPSPAGQRQINRVKPS